jgi:hypothetical protein
MIAAAPVPEGMREAIIDIIECCEWDSRDESISGAGRATDAILAIIAKGEGRE